LSITKNSILALQQQKSWQCVLRLSQTMLGQRIMVWVDGATATESAPVLFVPY